MTIRTPSPRPALFVEDTESDVLLLQRAFAKIGSPIPLLVFRDGLAAWEYLATRGVAGAEGTPSLLLLDLQLPGKSGLEILSALRGSPELRRIPVIVMTSSRERVDVDRAYSLGADFYLVKPVGAGPLRDMAEAIHAYWLSVSSDPDHVGADPTLSRLRKMAEPSPLSEFS